MAVSKKFSQKVNNKYFQKQIKPYKQTIINKIKFNNLIIKMINSVKVINIDKN